MLYIIRGLPGSGKTTLAHQLASATNGLVYEADDYFLRDGKYVFAPNLLGAAHEQCFQRTFGALMEHRTVIVANTFTTRWEYQRYIDLAEDMGFPWQMIICQGSFGSVHDVPEATIQRMRDRWEM